MRERYVRFDRAVTTPALWSAQHISGDRLRCFRGNDAYLWQLHGPNMNDFGYALTTYYVKSLDTLGLMDHMVEDTAFGNVTFTFDNRIISRDVLDSLIELYFLEKHLQISRLTRPVILDVGAGYGRLAHRGESRRNPG